MPSTLVFEFRDADERPGYMRFNIDDVTLPAQLVTDATAIRDALILAPNPMTTGRIRRVSVEVDIDALTNTAAAGASDSRLIWKVSAVNATDPTDTFTFQVPARNPAGVMTTVASKGELIDDTNTSWVAFKAAVFAAGLRTPDDDSADISGARAKTTTRQAPRI